MFKPSILLLKPFNTLLNAALKQDPESLEKLAPLAGKIIAIQWKALDIKVYAYLLVDEIRLSFELSKSADTTFSSSTPLSMLRLFTNPHDRELMGEVSIEGDVYLAQQVQKIFSGLAIDWEEIISRYLGDGPSYHIANIVKDFKQWSAGVGQNFGLNTTEFLQQETQQLPSRDEVNDFLKDIDTLKNDVERAAVRIRHLEERK